MLPRINRGTFYTLYKNKYTCHTQNYLAFMLQYNKQLLLLLQKLLKESLWLVFHWKTETQNSQSILHHYDI